MDDTGQLLSLSEFQPSVGVPAAKAARLQRVTVDTGQVVCVENATAFYEYVRHAGGRSAALCLWGNPSPACRHLLRCLERDLPAGVELCVWADIDYGGFRILAQLREHVSQRFRPYHMDVETFEAHARWSRPLTRSDERNLRRLLRHPALLDMRPVIEHMLARGLKLEQEAVTLHPD